MTNFIEAFINGLGQGAVYALIAVSFVIIYRATSVLNFAQPALMIIGTFFASIFTVDRGFPFWLSVILAMALVSAMSMGIERIALRPMVGRDTYSAAIVTVGIFIALLVLAFRLYAANPRSVGDPWGLDVLCLGGTTVEGYVTGCEGGLTIYQNSLARILIAGVVIAILGIWLAKSKLGLAMRATSLDQETALAQGIPVGKMFSISWGISGGLVALAGILLASSGGVVQASDALFALVALPAIIIGGLDSLKGAVIGGFIVGISMALTKAFQPIALPWLGNGFSNVVPYLIMLIVLLIKPYGLFGTKEVQRV